MNRVLTTTLRANVSTSTCTVLLFAPIRLQARMFHCNLNSTQQLKRSYQLNPFNGLKCVSFCEPRESSRLQRRLYSDKTSSDSDGVHESGEGDGAGLMDTILQKDPAFLQYFVHVFVPKFVTENPDSDFENWPKGKVNSFIKGAYDQWIEEGKPVPEDAPSDALT